MCLDVRVCTRLLQSRRLFQIGRWHLAGAFQEAIKISAIDLVKVLLDESIEIGAVDFVKVSLLASERYATEWIKSFVLTKTYAIQRIDMTGLPSEVFNAVSQHLQVSKNIFSFDEAIDRCRVPKRLVIVVPGNAFDRSRVGQYGVYAKRWGDDDDQSTAVSHFVVEDCLGTSSEKWIIYTEVYIITV